MHPNVSVYYFFLECDNNMPNLVYFQACVHASYLLTMKQTHGGGNSISDSIRICT